MTFKWLPDAALDPHPRLTWLVECCFDWTVTALYRKEEMLPPDYRLEPGTLVVSNHARDCDIPILTTVLCRREGFHIRWPLPFYASREDVFRPHFLSSHLVTWPRPLRALLYPISLGWFFAIVRAEPMRRTREYTLAEAFADLGIDDRAARAARLNARGRRESPRRQRNYGEDFWGLRRLRRTTRDELAPGFRATVAAELDRFAALLDTGRVVYFAPEGSISPDGRFGRVRAGPWRVVRITATPPPILPTALSYDALGPGRLRAILRIGRPLRGYNAIDRRRFDASLKEEILKLYPVNASHLASRYLAAGPDSFTMATFARWFGQARAALAGAGLTLDPLLGRLAPEALAGERLAWLARQGLLARDGETWHNRWPNDAKPGWRKPANIVRYLDNALDDLLRTLAPELARELAP